MKEGTRKSFYKEFKKMVVELHKYGKSSNEIGRELGIPDEATKKSPFRNGGIFCFF